MTVEDVKDGLIYGNVQVFPSASTSSQGYDMVMPEQGSMGIACNFAYDKGFRQVMIISWIHMDRYLGIDAVGVRQISGTRIQGYSDRLRGVYRKAFPGQKTSAYTGGASEKVDTGWDRQAADYSRDKTDADKRQWTQIAARRVSYTDAGVSFEGSVNRPLASNLIPVILPDGTMEYVAYLQPGAQPSDRYVSGKQDVIPFAEHTELTQEFSLDYPMPYEVLQTSLFNTVLGSTADPWARTKVTSPSGQVAYDNETYMITQTWDDPFDDRAKAVGPTLNEGPTPQRRAFIVEKSQGTLVGYNIFDQATYGHVLKPVLFPYNYCGRFGADVESGYLPVVDSADHEEARLAASCLAIRFPYDQNTTRLDVTKEGFISLEIGSTLPKENILKHWQGGYEHPHGAGRSLEAHLVGSAKIVIGKNRDEEDALDAQILGQSVIRLGADDASLPNSRRTVQTQIRSNGDIPATRTLQFWTEHKLNPGDAGSLTMKTGAENISLRAATDGGAVLRLGAKNPASLRRHLINGYSDGPGKTAYPESPTGPYGGGTDCGEPFHGRIDSKSPGRPTYGAGDNIYRFHDLTQVGTPPPNSGTTDFNPFPPYAWSGSPVINMDAHGQSLDLHAVRDALLRLGSNPDSGQSLLLDLAGGIVAALGKDNQGRSITAALDGGIEITILPNAQGKAMRLNIIGDVDISHKGHLQYNCGGDIITECTTARSIVKTDRIETQMNAISASLVSDKREAPNSVDNNGLYVSNENQIS
jgi:hypothetical protein